MGNFLPTDHGLFLAAANKVKALKEEIEELKSIHRDDTVYCVSEAWTKGFEAGVNTPEIGLFKASEFVDETLAMLERERQNDGS